MKNIVIFASGSGTNAENIMHYFKGNEDIRIAAVFSNNPMAGVLDKAEKHGIPSIVFTKSELADATVSKNLLDFSPDTIILAGFLLKFPAGLIESYPGRIINIHPALLPKYGGKGMYGMNVHQAIMENKDTETGITIHYIDEHYDEGDIIFQKSITLSGNETCEEIADKVRELEHEYFPQIIEKLLK